jgi:hypothetical protein
MKNEIQDQMGRPKRYENIDGTSEISMGLMILGFALLGYLQAALPPHSIWRNGGASLLFMYGVIVPALALGYWSRKAIKSRITWPRTGYVAYRRDGARWRASMAATFLGAGALAAFLAFLAMYAVWRHAAGVPQVVSSVILVASYGYFVFRMGGQHPWKWLVLVLIAAGLAAINLAVPGNLIEWSRPAALFTGLAWLGSGTATLGSYIRHTQPPPQEAQ